MPAKVNMSQVKSVRSKPTEHRRADRLDRLVGQTTHDDRPFYVGILQRVANRFRARRRRLFSTMVPTPTYGRILDLGCGNSQHAWFSGVPDVIGFDLNCGERPYPLFVCGDAAALPFSNKSFDLLFSNSLLEHLPTWELQKRCANEIKRVAFRYWVQVPHRHFPVDPHYLIPFFQYLPEKAMRRWARHFPLGWHQRNTYFECVNCLTYKQMSDLFPDAQIIREKVGLLTKSLIAFRDYEH